MNSDLRNFFLDEYKEEEGTNKPSSFCPHPGHYKTAGTSDDCIAYCLNNDIGFLEGNVIKYVTRWRQKNGLEDLRKAQEYLRRLIENEESHEEQS
jgi:hypothetical protein